ncbi:Alpha/Beta hydrolase protein [Parasitella parasitica]|nr:Alpha/Beta hydrolase protein [Parasitella parasitica]
MAKKILLGQFKRLYSSSPKSVPLSFTKYDIPTQEKLITRKQPLIICHGLFGSKQNWRSLAKSISLQCNCEVYTIDARNHGESPHDEHHTYDLMGNDLLRFITDHNIDNPMLMGHSMGGKVVMNVSLRYPELPSKLLVVDMAPVKLQLTREYSDHIQAMRDIQSRKLTRQRDADEILKAFEPDLIVRQFLLTNLKKSRSTGIYQFRIPFDILGQALSQLGGFSFETEPLPVSRLYQGPTLFITGGKSPFRKQFVDYPNLIKAQFPNSMIKNIAEAGHWVQTEKPQEFLNLTTSFINKE